MLVLSPKDHLIGLNVYDVISKKKIAYAKQLPFEYANIEAPYVTEESATIIKSYADFIGVDKINYLQTYYTADLSEIYGYFIDSNQNYAEGSSETINPIIKSFLDKKIEMRYYGIYITSSGNTRFHNVGIRTSNLDEVEEFEKLEKFELIRQCCKESGLPCNFRYCFDIENTKVISIYVNDCIFPYISMSDWYRKTTPQSLFEEKAKYYQKYVEKNILSQEQVDFILESSPRNQNTNLKFLWDDGEIKNIELDSVCVYEYDDV